MWQAVAAYFVSPLVLALAGGLVAAVCALLRFKRLAALLAASAFLSLWIASTPWVADALVSDLEQHYPAVAPQLSPQADAILVLGGAVSGAHPPSRPTLSLGQASTRVWHAAALYRAGKARWVVVAAGNRPNHAMEQVEAEAIAEVLVELGVPRAAIVQEGESRTTRENAAKSLPLLKRLGARRVLLVTSATHMPRAMKTFVAVWGPGAPELIPSPTDVRGTAEYLNPADPWLPSLEALVTASRAVKEFAGMAVLAIMR
jgi:uncharacterized SAM-binding protein YcdF (DUF218 family)